MEIRIINADDILEVRQIVLYPDKTPASLKLPEDDKGLHFGMFVDNTLISVISLFIEGSSAQFRKFATLPDYQGKGYGSVLLKHVIKLSSDKGCTHIWCNARTSAIDFYLRFGFRITDKTYSKDGVDFIIMEKNS